MTKKLVLSNEKPFSIKTSWGIYTFRLKRPIYDDHKKDEEGCYCNIEVSDDNDEFLQFLNQNFNYYYDLCVKLGPEGDPFLVILINDPNYGVPEYLMYQNK